MKDKMKYRENGLGIAQDLELNKYEPLTEDVLDLASDLKVSAPSVSVQSL